MQDHKVRKDTLGGGYDKASNRKDVVDDLESVIVQVSESLENQERLSIKSEASDLESEAQQAFGYQGARTRSALLESPVSQERLVHLTISTNDADTRHPQETLGSGLGPASPNQSSLLHSSPPKFFNAGPKISEVTAGKRPVSNKTEKHRFPKRIHPIYANTRYKSTCLRRGDNSLQWDCVLVSIIRAAIHPYQGGVFALHCPAYSPKS